MHEVCNALKRFLRNLSDPLLTAHLYGQWIATAGELPWNCLGNQMSSETLTLTLLFSQDSRAVCLSNHCISR